MYLGFVCIVVVYVGSGCNVFGFVLCGWICFCVLCFVRVGGGGVWLLFCI